MHLTPPNSVRAPDSFVFEVRAGLGGWGTQALVPPRFFSLELTRPKKVEIGLAASCGRSRQGLSGDMICSF